MLSRDRPSVEEEVAVLGAGYPDGVMAGERIAAGEIRVVPIESRKWARHMADYSLGDGEKNSIALCDQVKDVEALVTDDYLAFVVITRLGLKAGMLPDLVLELTERGSDSWGSKGYTGCHSPSISDGSG